MSIRRYLVTVHEPGNITSEAGNIHTILTSTDRILPRERVEVVAVAWDQGLTQTRYGSWADAEMLELGATSADLARMATVRAFSGCVAP